MIGTRKFRTPHARKRERVRVWIRIVAVLIVCAVAYISVLYLLHRPFARVHAVHVHTTGVLEPHTVEQSVRTLLFGTYPGYVPRDSVIFLSTKKIEKSLRGAFPRIDTVTVRRAGMRDIALSIIERKPIALWCGDVVPPIASLVSKPGELSVYEGQWGTCYLIDDTGYVYASAPTIIDNPLPRYYSSLMHAEPVGQTVLEPHEFAAFQDLFTVFVHDERPLLAVLIVDDRDVELYFGGGLRVFARRFDIPNAMVTRLDTLTAAGAIEFDRGVEYIDARFKHRIYVKYLDGNVHETVSESEAPAE